MRNFDPYQNMPLYEIKDTTVLFKNFSGAATNYNREGRRNFSVILPDDAAQRMAANGFNIKHENSEFCKGEPRPFIDVKVNYGYKNPPNIIMVGSKGKKTHLTESNVSLLDNSYIEHCDIVINGSEWEDKASRKTYMSAYLAAGVFYIGSNDILDRYAYEEFPEEEIDGEYIPL